MANVFEIVIHTYLMCIITYNLIVLTVIKYKKQMIYFILFKIRDCVNQL